MIAWPEGDDRYAPGSPVRESILRAIPLRRIGSPDDIARTVLFLAHSGFITGQTLAVDGGRTAAAAPEIH
jgi:NAD(P)-dependent dehydrogenase (short-subunit alcohol dehydrogenase family)